MLINNPTQLLCPETLWLFISSNIGDAYIIILPGEKHAISLLLAVPSDVRISFPPPPPSCQPFERNLNSVNIFMYKASSLFSR